MRVRIWSGDLEKPSPVEYEFRIKLQICGDRSPSGDQESEQDSRLCQHPPENQHQPGVTDEDKRLRFPEQKALYG